jgi:hypothetical protein
MSNKKISEAFIPAIIAGAAAYFGLTGKSSAIGDIAKTAVARLVEDQKKDAQCKKEVPHNQNRRRHKNRRRKFKKQNTCREVVIISHPLKY